MRIIAFLTALLISGSAAAAPLVSYDDLIWYPEIGEQAALFSRAAGLDLRQGTILNNAGDEDVEIYDFDNPIEFTTDASEVSVRALPAGTDTSVDPLDSYSARAQTNFGENHVAVNSSRHYSFTSESGDYFLNHDSAGVADSLWSDVWTFNGAGSVSLEIGWDATFEVDSICGGQPCGVNLPNGTDSALLGGIFYTYRAGFGVFDLDQLDTIYPNDGDPYEVPLTISSVFIRYDSYLNEQSTDPIAGEEVLTFTPIPGHRYVVAGSIQLQGTNGADVDAFNTLALTRVLLGPGMVLNSEAVEQLGASYNVVSAPEPSAAWLLAFALGGFGALRARRSKG
jgi:MYXO-CTERM domain-containing protein